MSGASCNPNRFWPRSRLHFVLLAFAWFWLLLLPTRMPTPTLEASWESVLNFGAARKLQHGVDLVFTYGPLGYAMQSPFFEGTWLRVVIFQVLTRAVYLALVYEIARRAGETAKTSKAAIFAFVAASLWLPALDADSFYLLFITMSGGLWCSQATVSSSDTGNPARSTSAQISSTSAVRWISLIAVALFGLVKTTYLGLGLIMLACWVIYSLIQRSPVPAIIMPLVYFGAFCFGWSILGQQHFANLGHWLRGTAESARSYQLAMGVWPEPNQLLSSLVAVLFVAVGMLAVLRRSWNSLPALVLLAAGCGLAWKQSFTRGDEFHTRTFFIYVIVAGALLPVLFGLAIKRVAAMFVLGICLGSSLLPRLPVPAYRAFENARFLFRLPRRSELWARRAQEYDLPKVRSIVGAASLDVAGAEQAIALFNGFNYRPAPVFQPYAAGTPYLARLNEAYYRSDRAPEFVLTTGYTIDNRLPNLDDSLTGLVLAQCYQEVTTENGFRLLHRVSQNVADPETVASGETRAGQTINLGGGRWCEVTIRETLLGRLLRLCWMSPPLYADLNKSDGSTKMYRFVPSMAQTGFVVPEGAVSLKVLPNPAVRWCFQPVIRYRLCRW